MFKSSYLAPFLALAFLLCSIGCDASTPVNGTALTSPITTQAGTATPLTTTTKLYKIKLWSQYHNSVSERWYGKHISWQPTHLEFIDCRTNRMVMISSNSTGSIVVEELPPDYKVSSW